MVDYHSLSSKHLIGNDKFNIYFDTIIQSEWILKSGCGEWYFLKRVREFYETYKEYWYYLNQIKNFNESYKKMRRTYFLKNVCKEQND